MTAKQKISLWFLVLAILAGIYCGIQAASSRQACKDLGSHSLMDTQARCLQYWNKD